MKKILLVLLLIAAFSISSLCMTSCNDNNDDGKVSIVVTVFPIYDWVSEIIGDADNVEITMLLDSGVDLHNFQPSVEDMAIISSCDMFIYVGGESDSWVDATLKNVGNDEMIIVNLIEVLGERALCEESVDGMEHSDHQHDEDDDHQHDEDDDHEHEHESCEGIDEHIWLSLRNAALICEYIEEKIAVLDEENAEFYSKNLETYKGALEALDAEYSAAVDKGGKDTFLFADRFPFLYLAHDYGINYYAAFSGCSAETEASFETIVFLADKVDELGLNCVLIIDGSDGKIANTVIENTENKNQEILSLNSMQSITLMDAEGGVSYLSVMRSNLETLEKALK